MKQGESEHDSLGVAMALQSRRPTQHLQPNKDDRMDGHETLGASPKRGHPWQPNGNNRIKGTQTAADSSWRHEEQAHL